MQSILLIYRVNQYSKKLSGVYKKLTGKAAELDRQGIATFAIFMQLNKAVLTRFREGRFDVILYSDIIEIRNEQDEFWSFAESVIDQHVFDMVYMRYERMFATPVIPNFLNKLIAVNEDTCRVIEFATYPYDQELRDEEKSRLDVPNRMQVLKRVDEIVSPAYVDTIDGYPYTAFCNKFDINAPDIASLALPAQAPDKACYDLIIVANIMFWHGVDRVINGLAEAADHIRGQVHLHVVGDGEEKAALEALVKSRSVESSVTFYGYQSGDALTELYQKADIGISSIGLHRQGLDECSDLKSREYVVHGLPLIKSFVDIDIDKLSDYVLNIPADDSPLNIEKVISFIRDHYNNCHKYEVNKAAKNIIGWQSFVTQLIALGEKKLIKIGH